MTVALKIVDKALREDFGFKNLLWVYSGRRGIHCWVSDLRARMLTNDGRGAVAEYLNVVAGGDAARKVKLYQPMYPALERALETCTEFFESWILAPKEENGQDILATAEHQKKLLAIVNDEAIEAEMLESWADDGQSSKQRWKELCDRLSKEAKKQSHKKSHLGLCKNEIIMQYTYPRLGKFDSVAHAAWIADPNFFACDLAAVCYLDGVFWGCCACVAAFVCVCCLYSNHLSCTEVLTGSRCNFQISTCLSR